MGIMSFVNTLASSPIGKVAGGYMEGEIDEWKEEARLKEKRMTGMPLFRLILQPIF